MLAYVDHVLRLFDDVNGEPTVTLPEQSSPSLDTQQIPQAIPLTDETSYALAISSSLSHGAMFTIGSAAIVFTLAWLSVQFTFVSQPTVLLYWKVLGETSAWAR
jgi:hypothetical protein